MSRVQVGGNPAPLDNAAAPVGAINPETLPPAGTREPLAGACRSTYGAAVTAAAAAAAAALW